MMAEVRGYRADVDGLRAIAVLSIVLFHLDIDPFTGGYVGVDIFFVISGYLITSIILRELAAGEFSIAAFYERRVRRILPALAVVLLVTLLAGTALLGATLLEELGRSTAATTVFASNFFFLQTAGYFDGPSELKPLLHTWSLAVEEQFYILFPLLLMFIARRRRARHGVWIVSLTAASFLACVIVTRWHPMAAFYLLPFRAWELLVGSVLALRLLPVIRSEARRNLASLSGLAMVLASVLVFDHATVFPGAAAALPVAGTALIIHAGIEGRPVVNRWLGNREMVFVGLVSYSLYLWHWPVIVYGKLYLINEPSGLEKAVMFAIALALAVLSWRFVERPFRGRQLLRARPRLFGTATAAFALILAGGLALSAADGLPGRDRDGSLQEVLLGDPGWSHWKDCQGLDDQGGTMPVLCGIGRDDAPPTFLLWGDSHALALASAVNLSADRHGAAGRLAGETACPPLLGIHRPGETECTEFNESVLDYLEHHPELNTVILVARWALSWHGTRYGQEEGHDIALVDTQASVAIGENNAVLFERGLRRTLAVLEALGRRVVLVAPVPEVGFDVPAANHAARLSGRDVSAIIAPLPAEHRERSAGVAGLFAELSPEVSLVVDPAEALCNVEVCRVVADGVPLYRDDNHLSLRGCVEIAGLFDEVFSAGPTS